MHKFLLGVVVAVLGAGVLASSASAFDHHFNVLSKQTSSKRVSHTKFRFKDKLLNPKNRHDRVGRDRGQCKFNIQTHNVKCRAVAHLNGKFAGSGDIKVRGDFGRGDHRLNVVGGSGQFNGVAGKLKIQTLNPKVDRLHFDLTR